MSEWKAGRLDSYIQKRVISLGRGNIISKDDISLHPGSYPIYSSSAHNNGKFGEYNKYMFDEELITWSVDGGGYFFYRPKHKYSVTNVCGFMRIKDESLDAKFVFYCLSNQHNFLTFDYTTKAHPSVINRLYWLPELSKERQQKIATILQTIDYTIEKTEALIEKYQQIKAGLMHDLFTRGITADGKLRPPREQAPELYQETPIGWMPKDWCLITLGELSNKLTSGSRNWARYYSKEGDLFVRISNLTREHINFRWDSIKYVDVRNNTEGQRTKLMEGDILISITADLGIIGVIPPDFGTAFINQHTALLRPDTSMVNPRFLGNLLSSIPCQKQFNKFNDSGAKAGLNLPTIEALTCFKPNIEEQNAIAERLDSCDEIVAKFKLELSKLIKQKQGLMQDLLTGKVPVKVDNEAVHA